MQKKNGSERKKEGWNPDAPDEEQALADEERSLDIGESGNSRRVVITINKESVNQGIAPLMMTMTRCHRVVTNHRAE